MLVYNSPVFIYVYVPIEHTHQKLQYLNKTRATHEHHISTDAELKSDRIAG